MCKYMWAFVSEFDVSRFQISSIFIQVVESSFKTVKRESLTVILVGFIVLSLSYKFAFYYMYILCQRLLTWYI